MCYLYAKMVAETTSQTSAAISTRTMSKKDAENLTSACPDDRLTIVIVGPEDKPVGPCEPLRGRKVTPPMRMVLVDVLAQSNH